MWTVAESRASAAAPVAAPRHLDVVHVDLHFFLDVESALPDVERQAGDLPLAAAEAPPAYRLALFGAVFVATAALTICTMVKSKRLSDFLDALSDERLGGRDKVRAFAGVWRRRDGE